MLCLALTAALLLFLAACGNSPKQAIEAPTVPQNQDASTTEPEVTQGNAASESSHRFLIAYFTAAENSDVDAVSSSSVVTVDGAPKGRVQALAEIIQRDTGGDLFSIRTSTVYPGDGGKFEDFAAEEQNAKARPELATRIENLDAYDVIFVGYRPLGKPNFITQHFDILLAKNKLEKIRFHDLRHPYVKHATKIFSLRLKFFQAQAYLILNDILVELISNNGRKEHCGCDSYSNRSWTLYAISMRLSGNT